MHSILFLVDLIQQFAVPADDLCHYPVALRNGIGFACDPFGLFLQLPDVDDGQSCLDQPLLQFPVFGVHRNAAQTETALDLLFKHDLLQKLSCRQGGAAGAGLEGEAVFQKAGRMRQ